jgi:hypothetical protein
MSAHPKMAWPVASFHLSHLLQLQLYLAEARRHILHSRKMIVDTQRSILTLDRMLRELSMIRRDREKIGFNPCVTPKVFDERQTDQYEVGTQVPTSTEGDP